MKCHQCNSPMKKTILKISEHKKEVTLNCPNHGNIVIRTIEHDKKTLTERIA